MPAFWPVTLPFTTVAMRSSELVQVTLLSLASAGCTVTFACVYRPVVTRISAGLILSPVTGWITEIVMFPFAPDPSAAVAVITAFPRFSPVTFPFESTLAICGFFDAQTIPLMEASAGWHSPVSRIVNPLATVLFSAWIWMDFTGWVTRILKVSVASGLSALVMVMSHSPRCIALSALLFITLATPSSSVVNRTVLLLASIGVHTAERLTVDPAATAMTLYSSSSSSNGVIAGSSGS